MVKVLHIGYGIPPVWQGGELYKISLMKELSRQGWTVTAFLAGRYDFKLRPYLRYSSEEGMQFIELRNSPYTFFNINRRLDPMLECTSPIIEHFTAKVLKQEKPDIVHIHDLKTFGASIIDLITARGIPVIKTAYHYWDICSQGNLLYRGEQECLNFEDGKKCVDCLNSLDEEYFPFMPQIFDSVKNTRLYPLVKKVWVATRPARRKINRLKPRTKRLPFLSQSYAYRREFFIQRLNKLSFILCPGAMGQILVNYGVAKERIYPILTNAPRLERILLKPLRNEMFPIIFGFFGGSDRRKGIHLLLDAFQSLDKERAKLLIYGMINSPLPRHDGIEIRGQFKDSDFNEVLAEIDVGMVPSLSDPCPAIISEFRKARIPIIGSDVDGIPDLLRQGECGLLCKSNDADDLALKMNSFVREPSLIRKMQERMAPPKTMEEHAGEISSIYEQTIATRK
ncbi:glycosyltransferase [Chloroflexota bacterium]